MGEVDESDVADPAPGGSSPIWTILKILGVIVVVVVIYSAYVLYTVGHAVEESLSQGAGSAIRDGTVKVLDGLSHVK